MKYVHLVRCAHHSFCTNSVTWQDSNGTPEVPVRIAEKLESSGWRLDQGKWICGEHAIP